METSQTNFERLPATDGSPVHWDESTETFIARKPTTRFLVWRGRDTWHRVKQMQIRLERDGSILISTTVEHSRGPEPQLRTMTFDEFFAILRRLTSENSVFSESSSHNHSSP